MPRYIRVYTREEMYSVWSPERVKRYAYRRTFEQLPAWIQDAVSVLDLTAPETFVTAVGYRPPRQADDAQIYFLQIDESAEGDRRWEDLQNGLIS